VVAFLSSDRVARAYQLDLLAELHDKGLGLCRVVTGEMVPPGVAGSGDLIVSRPSMPGVDDSSAAVLDAIVGQLLAFFRALHEGFRPDSPSVNGVINRVVGGFRIHDAQQAGRP
jgi:tagatose-6-phosphate ketose/aldose isomerase